MVDSRFDCQTRLRDVHGDRRDTGQECEKRTAADPLQRVGGVRGEFI